MSTSSLLLPTIGVVSTSITTAVSVVTTEIGNLQDQVPKYLVYIIEGFILWTSNLLIFITIISQDSMRSRKEYIIVAGLAFADGMSGVAQFYAGIYRTYLVAIGDEMTLLTRWECLLTPHNLLWIWVETMQPLMLLLISVDRFFAVAFPLKHMVMTDVYAKRMVFGAYGAIAIQTAYGIYLTWPYQVKKESIKVCWTSEALHSPFSRFYATVMIGYAFASVLLYAMILPIYLSKRRAATNDDQVKKNMKQQRRLTITLGISCVITLFLNCIPSAVALIADMYDWDLTSITPSAYIFYQLNPILNFLLYFSRHKDIRKALLNRLGLKKWAARVDQSAVGANKSTTGFNTGRVLRVGSILPVN